MKSRNFPLSVLVLFVFAGFVQAESRYPALGVIDVGTSLNIRTAPENNAKILGRLKRDEKVVVLGETGEYYKLQYPKQLEAWVASWLLLENGAGQSDKVSRDKVNIRSGPSMQYPVIARLSKGYEVQIEQINSSKWAKITPPSTSFAYAAKKYVRLGENYNDYIAKESKRKEAIEKFNKTKLEIDKFVNLKKIGQEDFEKLMTSLNECSTALAGTADAALTSDYKVTLSEIRRLSQIHEIKKKVEEEHIAKTQHLIQKHDEKMSKILTEEKKTPLPKYQYTGWLDDVGGIFWRPASHKLKEGNQVLFYLKSGGVDLDPYVGKRVGINGKLESFRAGWGKIITVEDIDILLDDTSVSKYPFSNIQ